MTTTSKTIRSKTRISGALPSAARATTRSKGGAGTDRFAFAEGSGQDTINDFARGEDLIDGSGYTNIVFADLVLDTTTDPGNTVIDLGLANGAGAGTDVLTVEEVVDLSSGDFLFA
jgi:hypothetical protein